MIDAWITEVDTTELVIPADQLSPWLRQAQSLQQAGAMKESLACAPVGVDLRGVDALVWAGILWQASLLTEAATGFERACTDLAHPLVWNEAARFFRQQGQWERAVALRRQGLARSPENALLNANLGDDLVAGGQQEEGLALLEQAKNAAPDNAVIRSMWLSSLHYGEILDRSYMTQEHRQWGQRHGPHPTQARYANTIDPDRPLCIGYVSADFRRHSVATYFEPLLDAHDRGAFRIVGYGNVGTSDVITARLINKFDHYRAIYGVSDETAVAKIQADGIDILVDLGGHFSGNRLGIFTHKPAPVQVTYLGYPDTTGLMQIDYRLTDPWADTENADPFYMETLWRLPQGFLCFRPPDQTPTVGPLPVLTQGGITFGSFNNNAKINQTVLQTWARILQNLPQARLVLKFRHGDITPVCQHYLLALSRLGVSRERVEILGWLSDRAHLDLYNRIDMALDTYPYNGTTTTCEALWMGVPTLSLVDEHHAARVGLSLLTQVGLEAFVARSPDEYVNKALAFAGQKEALATIRASLRGKLLSSPLCDAGRLARSIEQAYRSMWRQWCEKQKQ